MRAFLVLMFLACGFLIVCPCQRLRVQQAITDARARLTPRADALRF